MIKGAVAAGQVWLLIRCGCGSGVACINLFRYRDKDQRGYVRSFIVPRQCVCSHIVPVPPSPDTTDTCDLEEAEASLRSSYPFILSPFILSSCHPVILSSCSFYFYFSMFCWLSCNITHQLMDSGVEWTGRNDRTMRVKGIHHDLDVHFMNLMHERANTVFAGTFMHQ